MILKVPSYYEKFHCIADQCKDNCCYGWEIDIDEGTTTAVWAESWEKRLPRISRRVRRTP